MESNDLSSKKMNNKQIMNEGFSGQNMEEDAQTGAPILNNELETDANGDQKIVQRARNVDGSLSEVADDEVRSWNDNESLSRGVTSEKDVMKTIENEDRNSDITANRYPNNHPDHQADRGNMKLDE